MTVKLGKDTLKLLSQMYTANALIQKRLNRYDLAFKTDEQGRPVLLFMGRADDEGRIKGERFARRLVINREGQVIKDHWDNKGKTG